MNERKDASAATHAPASRLRKRRPSFLRPAERLTFGAIAVALAALFLWLFEPLLFPASTSSDLYAQFRAQAPFGKLTLFPLQLPPGPVYTLLQDTTTTTRLWAATQVGVYVSDNSGQTWRATSEGLPRGYVGHLLQDATTPTRLWAATPEGVYVSDNSAQTWRPTSESLKSVYVSSLLQDVRNPKRLLAGINDSPALSPDGGKSWQNMYESSSRLKPLASMTASRGHESYADHSRFP